MDKNEIQKMIQDEINAYMKAKQFTVSKIPNHLHNGTDSQKISEADLIPAPTYATFLTENVSETFTITNLPATLTSVTFSGIAYDSSSSPASKKALVFGNVIFQNCFTISGSGTSFPVNNLNGISLIQTGSSIYMDTSDLTKTRVGTSSAYFVYVINDSGTVVASLIISSFSRGILSITSALSANWIIQGTLTLT